MDGGPGIYSSRFCGERTYAEACREIIGIVDEKGNGDRRARYCCAVVCCFPDGREISCFATTEGEIAHELRGSGGFGYDPMFLLPEGRTMAELTEDEKNAISHRGRAFRELLRRLKEEELC
jgi:XTP/dITP diphosphohydrolase